jgi:formylglycine-generating enzyme required for sulfatase activity
MRHIVKLTRPFALLDREITWEELIAYKPMYANFMQQSVSSPNAAGAGADWYHSVGFCRWLGEQMGLAESEQAYLSPETLEEEEFPRDPDPRGNWAPQDWPLDLDRRGFRLLTDAEWEVATRGGSRTAYGFGGDALLLDRFGWFAENSGKQMHPTKELRPSLRGLFDLHGNLWEWTHDWYESYSAELETDPIASEKSAYRVLRGGGWSYEAANCRSSSRNRNSPVSRVDYYGFRLALSSPGILSSAEAEPAAGR